jgi:hypothetical protein
MSMSRNTPRWAGLAGAWFLLAGAAANSNAPRASGRWTVDGGAVELRHAVAFREVDPFGKGTNPCVLASTAPVAVDAVPVDDAAIVGLLERMRTSDLRALQVCFDASGTKLRSVHDVVVFHPAVSPGRFALQGFHTFSPSASARATGAPAAGENVLRIAGRLTGSGTTQADRPWSVDLTLDLPLPAE